MGQQVEKAQDLNEVIKMTYTFIDREIENGIKNGEKKGKFELLISMIKKGRITLEEAASDIGMTVEQLLSGFKEYNLVL